jgi:hypothetical protein
MVRLRLLGDGAARRLVSHAAVTGARQDRWRFLTQDFAPAIHVSLRGRGFFLGTLGRRLSAK